MNSAEPATKANILIAFPYWNDGTSKAVEANPDKIRLVIDSGAFTAWKAGKPIAIDDYCRFLEGLKVKPWRYFTLDVIGDAAGSLRNYEIMRKRGFKPVPIFTRGEDPSVLEDYYKTSDVVGIGGLVGTRHNKGFVNGIMKRVGKRRVHWLGFTGLDYLKFYRPYMCDSSSWEGGARFGTIRLYMGNGRFATIKKADCRAKLADEICSRIGVLGFDPYDLRKLGNWHGGVTVNRMLCAASAVALSLDIQKNIGTLVFNAIAESRQRTLQFFLSALDHQLKGKTS